jgi:hypothetical protein
MSNNLCIVFIVTFINFQLSWLPHWRRKVPNRYIELYGEIHVLGRCRETVTNEVDHRSLTQVSGVRLVIRSQRP